MSVASPEQVTDAPPKNPPLSTVTHLLELSLKRTGLSRVCRAGRHVLRVNRPTQKTGALFSAPSVQGHASMRDGRPPCKRTLQRVLFAKIGISFNNTSTQVRTILYICYLNKLDPFGEDPTANFITLWIANLQPTAAAGSLVSQTQASWQVRALWRRCVLVTCGPTHTLEGRLVGSTRQTEFFLAPPHPFLLRAALSLQPPWTARQVRLPRPRLPMHTSAGERSCWHNQRNQHAAVAVAVAVAAAAVVVVAFLASQRLRPPDSWPSPHRRVSS